MCDGPMLEAQKACDAVKDFATVVLDELGHDAHWLNRATDAVPRHWQGKNACKTKPQRGAA